MQSYFFNPLFWSDYFTSSVVTQIPFHIGLFGTCSCTFSVTQIYALRTSGPNGQAATLTNLWSLMSTVSLRSAGNRSPTHSSGSHWQIPLLFLITWITSVKTWIILISTSWWYYITIFTLHSGLHKWKAKFGTWQVWFVGCVWMMVDCLQYAVHKAVKEIWVAIITWK